MEAHVVPILWMRTELHCLCWYYSPQCLVDHHYSISRLEEKTVLSRSGGVGNDLHELLDLIPRGAGSRTNTHTYIWTPWHTDLSENYEHSQRGRKLQLMSLPTNPLNQRRDIVNSSKMRPINQAGCRDSGLTQADIVSSMFQINLCFSQYLCWDGITWSCLALKAGSHALAVNTDTSL